MYFVCFGSILSTSRHQTSIIHFECLAFFPECLLMLIRFWIEFPLSIAFDQHENVHWSCLFKNFISMLLFLYFSSLQECNVNVSCSERNSPWIKRVERERWRRWPVIRWQIKKTNTDNYRNRYAIKFKLWNGRIDISIWLYCVIWQQWLYTK